MSLFKYFQKQSSSQSAQEDATGKIYHNMVQFRDDIHTLSLLAPVESEMGINSAGDDCASNPVQQLSSEDETESDDPPPAAKRVALDEASQPLFTNIAQVIGSHHLSASTRHSLLNHHFRPDANYNFRKGSTGTGRSFQLQWLQSFPRLVYSKQTDGGFCLPCILFAPCGYHWSNPGVLVTRPLTNFKKALEMLHNHTDKEHHKVAIVRAEEFERSMSAQQPDIQQRMSKSLAERISTNRQKLSSIMKHTFLWSAEHCATWSSG